MDVRVALPNVSLLTDVAPVIRRDGLRMDVDGLRDAVMAKLAGDNIPGVTLRNLRVYPPGAARGAVPIADPYTELESTTKEAPYHVAFAGVSS